MPPAMEARILFFFFNLFISVYLFLAALSHRCLVQVFSSCTRQGLFSSFGAWASPAVEQRL